MLKVHTLSRELVKISKFRDHCFINLTVLNVFFIKFFSDRN